MQTISTYHRETWADIAKLGEIVYIAVEASHYITVGYRKLSDIGEKYFAAAAEDTKCDLGEDAYKVLGFSVAWFNVPREMLKYCNNVYNINTVADGHLQELFECVRLTRMTKLTEDIIDVERGSVYYNDGLNAGLIIGPNLNYQNMALQILNIVEALETRISVHRTLWYKWLKEAEFVPMKTGNVFKFPNGFTVKMDDNPKEVMDSDGYRLFAESREPGGNIERHYTEEEFLVYLTKFF